MLLSETSSRWRLGAPPDRQTSAGMDADKADASLRGNGGRRPGGELDVCAGELVGHVR